MGLWMKVVYWPLVQYAKHGRSCWNNWWSHGFPQPRQGRNLCRNNPLKTTFRSSVRCGIFGSPIHRAHGPFFSEYAAADGVQIFVCPAATAAQRQTPPSYQPDIDIQTWHGNCAQMNEMNANILNFVFEWGPTITAVISLIYGVFYARICCLGTPTQKVVVWFIFLFMVLVSLISMGLTGDMLEVHPISRGEFFLRLLFGMPPIPLLAGMGIYAWSSPEKWVTLAESRKYMRELKAK
jgi:hypothetical protein